MMLLALARAGTMDLSVPLDRLGHASVETTRAEFLARVRTAEPCG